MATNHTQFRVDLTHLGWIAHKSCFGAALPHLSKAMPLVDTCKGNRITHQLNAAIRGMYNSLQEAGA